MFKLLQKTATTLEDIALIKWTNITDLSMDYLSSITTLTRIQLSGCRKLTSAGIMRVIQTNPGLQHIDIANVLQADDSINFLVSSIGSGCPVLISLKLSFALPNKVTMTSMLIVARSCPLLEVLDVKGFPQNDKYLVALSSSCPQLKYFTLTGSDVTDTGLLALTRGCRQVEALTMDNATHITNIGLTGVATNSAQLARLLIKSNEHITDKSLCAVFQACPKLISVTLEKCPLITDRAITTLAQFRAGLKFLQLFENILLTERSVLAILAHPTSLTTLTITHIPVTDDSMILITRYCTYLRSVTLMHCNLITIRTLKAFAENCKHLRVCMMNSCTQVKHTPEVIAYFKSIDIKKKTARGLHMWIDRTLIL